jgi:hypothetical protein
MCKCSAALKKGGEGSIYSHGSKTSRLTRNPTENRLNRPLTGQQTDLQAGQTWQDRLNRPLGQLNRPWQPWWPDCQSDWQTAGQKSEGSETSWTAPQDQFSWSRPESLGEKTSAQLPGGKFSWCMVKEVHSWSWSSAGVESSTQLKFSSAAAEVQLSCSQGY